MSRTALSIVSFLTAATVSLGCGGGTATPGGSTTDRDGRHVRARQGRPRHRRRQRRHRRHDGARPDGQRRHRRQDDEAGDDGNRRHRDHHRHSDAGHARHRLPGRRPQRHGAARARLHARQRARVPDGVRRLRDQRDQRAHRHDRAARSASTDRSPRTTTTTASTPGRDDRIPARDGGRAGVLPLPHHLRPGVRRQHVRRQRDRLGHEGPHVQGSGRQRSRRAVAVRRDAGAGVDVRHRLHHRQRRLGLPLRRAGRQRRRGEDAGGRREIRPRLDDVARSQSERLRLLQELRLRRRLHRRLAGDRRAATRPTRPRPTGTTASSTRSGSTPPRSPARASAAPASRSSTRRRPRPAPTPSP